MVSVDTPEKAGFAGAAPVAQPKLDRCRQQLRDGTYAALPDDLRSHLLQRLTPDAADRHITAGVQASQYFDALLSQRLARADGTPRRLAVLPAGELLDRYGRLLAYLAPWYAGTPGDPLPPKSDPRRRTFNLEMITAGWGVLFLVYPSLPADPADYAAAVEAARTAWDQQQGMWQEHGEELLLPYEYRACVRLGTIEDPLQALEQAFTRVCYDLRTGDNLGLYGYPRIPPWTRLWVWQDTAAPEPGTLPLLS